MPKRKAPTVTYAKFTPRDIGALIAAAAVFLSVSVLTFLIPEPRDDAWKLRGAGVVLATLAIVAGAVAWFRIVARRRARRFLQNAICHTRRDRRQIIEALIQARGLERRWQIFRAFPWDYQTARSALQKRGLALPLCIVDRKLRGIIPAAVRNRALLECETLGEAMGGMSSLLSLVLAVICIAVGVVLRQWNTCIGIPVIVFGFGILAAVLQQWYVGVQGSKSRLSGGIAGPGTIFDGRQYWLAAECLTIVRVRHQTLDVDIVGPAGTLRLRYAGAPSGRFEDFWTRWMHPEPRPDLVRALVSHDRG